MVLAKMLNEPIDVVNVSLNDAQSSNTEVSAIRSIDLYFHSLGLVKIKYMIDIST